VEAPERFLEVLIDFLETTTAANVAVAGLQDLLQRRATAAG
jgi:hypothetical protein